MSRLSIVVSVYNEEAALPHFFEAFDAASADWDFDWELLFVNDGSADKSLAMLKDYCGRVGRAKLVSFSRNFGHEAAMIAGIDHASGDGVACMDADLQHPLECIPPIVQKLDEGYDVISMVREENKSAGLIKNITSKGFYNVINSLSDDAHFQPNASDFFAVSRRVADVLRTNYREKSRFLRGYVQSVGYRSTTLSYVAAERSGGTSHYSLKKLWNFSMSTIVSFSNVPLKLGVYMGLVCAGLGLVLLVYTLCTREGAPSGYATIVIMMCFLFAMLFVLVGVIGEYLAVLFSEIKDRPIYLVDETMNLDDGRTGK